MILTILEIKKKKINFVMILVNLNKNNKDFLQKKNLFKKNLRKEIKIKVMSKKNKKNKIYI